MEGAPELVPPVRAIWRTKVRLLAPKGLPAKPVTTHSWPVPTIELPLSETLKGCAPVLARIVADSGLACALGTTVVLIGSRVARAAGAAARASRAAAAKA